MKDLVDIFKTNKRNQGTEFESRLSTTEEENAKADSKARSKKVDHNYLRHAEDLRNHKPSRRK